MNKKTTFCLIAILGIAILAGCTMFGANPSPPTKVEQGIFDVKTNYVTRDVYKTNIVEQTKEVIVPVTNFQNQVIFQTNAVKVYETNQVAGTITNETYDYAVKDKTKTLANGVGIVANVAAPGSGGWVSSGILLVLGAWAQWRSTKRQATSVTLVQQLETVREFIKTLPQGAKYDDAITKWLTDHQVETGVAKQVIDILNKELDTDAAKGAAITIKSEAARTSPPVG